MRSSQPYRYQTCDPSLGPMDLARISAHRQHTLASLNPRSNSHSNCMAYIPQVSLYIPFKCKPLHMQELEGRRVPRMLTGKTLPCFAAFDGGARSGGFIGDRFLSGRWFRIKYLGG